MGMTLSPYTQRLDPQGGSLATRGYDPDSSLFSISVCLALLTVCVCVRSACLESACAKKCVFMCVARLLIALMLRTQHIVDKILIGFNTIITLKK